MLLGPVAVNGFPARRMTNSNTYQGAAIAFGFIVTPCVYTHNIQEESG